jgi:hypothetical protein
MQKRSRKSEEIWLPEPPLKLYCVNENSIEP